MEPGHACRITRLSQRLYPQGIQLQSNFPFRHEKRVRPRPHCSDRMPGMIRHITGVWLHRPNLAHRGLAACAGLLFLLTGSQKLFPAGAQTSGSSQAKPAAKFDTSKLVIAPNLASQLAKFKPVRMPYDSAQLTARERQMVAKLVEACRALESIYWRQSDPEGLKLYNDLAGSAAPLDKDLRRFLRINGSRFDLIDNNAPFVGTAPWPPGRGLFPSDLTHEEFDRYVAAHPDQKASLYDPWTVVRRKGAALEAIPYHVAYRTWLDPAVKALQDAAALSDDPAFAKFLRLRADSLLTDNYFDSDLAWVSLENPKFDIIYAPYET